MTQAATLEDIFKLAQAAYQERRHAEAARLFEILKQHAPPHAKVLSALADIYRRLADWPRAIENAELAQALAGEAQPLAFVTAVSTLLQTLQAAHGDQAAKIRYLDFQSVLLRMAGLPGDLNRWDAVLDGLAACAAAGDDPALAHRVLERRFPNGIGLELPAAALRCMTVENWCESAGVARTPAAPPRHITIASPDMLWDYCADGTYLTVVPGGEGVAGTDLAAAPGNIMLSDSGHMPLGGGNPNYFPCILTLRREKVIHLWPATVQQVDADALFLGGTHDMAIGHWIIDLIPRLRFLEWPAFRDFRVAIPSMLSDKHRELLTLCGAHPERLIEVEFGARVGFRNLLVVQQPPHSRATPEAVEYLAAKLRIADKPAVKRRRILIVRATPTRRIANASEVMDVLTGYGFETIDLAQLSIEEQRQRLGGAEIAICTFGSDWLAELMLPPGADFLEFNFSDRESGAGGTAAMIGVNYHNVMCAPADTSPLYGSRRTDFTVDAAALDAVLKEIVARKCGAPDEILPVTVTYGPVENRPLDLWRREPRPVII